MIKINNTSIVIMSNILKIHQIYSIFHHHHHIIIIILLNLNHKLITNKNSINLIKQSQWHRFSQNNNHNDLSYTNQNS